MTSASYDSNFTTVGDDDDPRRRVGNTRTIAGANMFIGVASLVYHIWRFVEVLRDPKSIDNTGQTEVVVYMGLVIMIMISITLLPVSWNLFKSLEKIRSSPTTTIRISRCWRRWMWSFLIFFIVSLMIMVLSRAEVYYQNYMAGLLIISTFTVFGLYYVGKLVDDIISYNESIGAGLNNVCPLADGIRLDEGRDANLSFVGER